jgi:type-F conjugative transfer system secretin TraK
MKKAILLMLCSIAYCTSALHAEKQEYNFDDTKSLVLKVSDTGLTRISVQGDRLREVIGLDDTVNVEKDEANGHLFLKGVKTKQTITVVTEGGALQDLTLLPTAKGSTTILLRNEQTSKSDIKRSPLSLGESIRSPLATPSAISPSNTIISFMRQLCAGQGTAPEHKTKRTTTGGLEATSTHHLQAQNFVGEVYTVTNTHDHPTALCEKDFYQMGDLALAVTKKELEPGEEATLYVVRNG